MKAQLFQTLWGHAGGIEAAIDRTRRNGFEGVEGPPPADPELRSHWAEVLASEKVPYIAEISATGFAVPDPGSTVGAQLEAFERVLVRGLEVKPLFFSTMAGSDLWTLPESIDFLDKAHEIARRYGARVGFETHRSRSLFHPIRTREILRELPEIELTIDFSHWCVVTERLVLDELPEVLELCAERVLHIQPRVGYDQGAQVPDPRVPEYRDALGAHLRWWRRLWDGQRKRGFETVTLTPEFGPDGYLHLEPYTGRPVADLDDLNAWMGRRVREEFAAWEGAL